MEVLAAIGVRAAASALAAIVAGTATAPAAGPEGLRPEFHPAKSIPAGPMTGRPCLADMNADGTPDIVVACGSPESPEGGYVVVLLNDGNGRFEPAGGRVLVGPSARRVAVGDFSGDKIPDVAAVEHDSYNVTVLINNGRGGLEPAPFSPVAAATGTSPHTHDVACADVDGDGRPDILTANADDNTISVLLNTAGGGMTPAAGSPAAAGRHPYSIATGDVNADGAVDLVMPLLDGNEISVLIGDGRGGFRGGGRHRVGARPAYTAVADVNGDSRPDIIATHDDHGIVDVLLGDGAGGFAAGPGSPARFRLPVWGAAAADIDGDGKTDLVLGVATGSEIVVAFGDGSGGFDEGRSMRLRAGEGPGYAEVGDLNSDGRPDIVTADYDSGTLSVLLAK